MHYKVCTRCIMDNRSDGTITFDQNGYCNYCTEGINSIKKGYFPGKEGERKLKNMLDKVKLEGKDKKYDCMMGISGGLDSSYLAYLGEKWGLRILAVHIDDGFDTEITKDNLKKLSEGTNIELIDIIPDQEQYNNLIKAYLRAGVPNLAVPQDNILFAYLYKYAKENGIKYFLSGQNLALESILQRGNTYIPYDLVNIKDIHKSFGTKPIDKLPLLSLFKKDVDRFILKIETLCPLDYIDYNRVGAFKELNEFCGFTYYGGKHLENELTKFIQLYYFPKKFNVDKRTSHFSSLIISGQITREEALTEIKKPLYNEEEMNKTITYVLNKLELTKEELDKIMDEPSRQHNYYKTSLYVPLRDILAKIRRNVFYR